MLKLTRFHFIVIIAILAIHALLSICGLKPVNVEQIFWYIIDFKFLRENFFSSLIYFHEIPPLLSIIHYGAEVISFGHRYLFFALLLPLLHSLCFLLFSNVIHQLNFKYDKLFLAIIFLNPAVFIYFRFPFYSTFLFVQSILFLFVLIGNFSSNKKLIFITVLLVIAALERSSYNLLIVILLLLPFILKASKRTIFICLVLLLIPFSLYLKNYVLFGKFTSSTLTGMYFHGHIDKNIPGSKIKKIGICRPVAYYKDFINENDPMVIRYKHVPILNQNDMNNIRYLQVSDEYLKEFKENFDLFYSIKYVSLGIIRYMSSPSADYKYLNTYLDNNSFKLYDLFDLPNIQLKNETKTVIPFSLYLFVYPFILIFLLFYFRKLTFVVRYILLYTIFFSILYAAIDPAESMRMRFEIEPFFYFLLLFVLANYKVLKNKQCQIKSKALF